MTNNIQINWKREEIKGKFDDLMNSSDAKNHYNCANRYKGHMPFDGPFAIIDEHNPYCELFARMYSSYCRELQEGKRDDKRIKEMDVFLERMLRRECTEEEFRSWVNHARWRVESGKEDKYLRSSYLSEFPSI